MDEPRPAPGDVLAGWYTRHRVELVRLATLALGDRGRAEDVVHDVFATMQRRPPVLADPDRALPYLRTAVLNRCRTGITRRITGRAALARVEALPVPVPATPEDDAVQDAARARILAAVRRLPRRQRDVVLLRYWLDLSEADIAATLGVSRGTVKTSASRALAALGPVLEEER